MEKPEPPPSKVDLMHAKLIATACSVALFFVTIIILSQFSNNGSIIIGVGFTASTLVWLAAFHLSKNGAHTEKLEESREAKIQQDNADFLKEINRLCHGKTIDAKIIASTHPGTIDGTPIVIGHDSESIHIGLASTKNFIRIEISDLIQINISGPGTVTSNAGVTGGGFGIEGFVKGALVAAAINALTTQSTTTTLMQIITKKGEIFIHTKMVEPFEMRLMFSAPIAKLLELSENKKTHPASISEEIERIHELANKGVLSQDEFEEAKRRLIQKI